MDNDKLARYLSSLSDEEKGRYRHLIEDALERDRKTAEIFTQAKARVENYEESLKLLGEESMRLKTSLAALTKKLSEVADVSERVLNIFSQGPSWNSITSAFSK